MPLYGLLVMMAMLCKEQGITVFAVCAVYEIFILQKVSSEGPEMAVVYWILAIVVTH